MSRKKRLANGKLRPAARRYKAKRSRAKREAWLAKFKPGDRDRFFAYADVPRAVFLAGFQRETGLDRFEAAELLERIAAERGWMKLRTLDRVVVGIAPPRTAPRLGCAARRDDGTIAVIDDSDLLDRLPEGAVGSPGIREENPDGETAD